MRKWWKFFGVLGLLVVLFFLLTPKVGRLGHSDRIATTQSNIRFAAISILNWTTSGGRIKHLEDLSYLPEGWMPYMHCRYFDSESNRGYDWLYFGGSMTGEYPSNKYILLAAPVTFESQTYKEYFGSETCRVVAYADGSAGMMSEEEFWKRVRLQERGIFEEVIDEK